MSDFLNRIIYLTEGQFNILKTNHTITVGSQTINFSNNDIYVTDSELATNDPVASGTSISFISSITQDNKGKITATKANIDTSGTWSGNAATATYATKANLTTTTNAVAYYTNTTGTFGYKASANGALYATSANGALQWGTLPIAQGGTGQTSAQNAANALISGLPTWTASPTADTYFIRRDTGGTATFGQVKFSSIANITNGVITLGPYSITPVTSVNGHTGSSVNVTAGDLGLSSALRYQGTTTTAMEDGRTTATVIIGGNNFTPTQGDVVIYNDAEYVWTGSLWELLGAESSFKKVQTAVSSSSASGNSATTFVSSVTQDAQGVITVKTSTLNTSGTWSGNAVTATSLTSNAGGGEQPIYFTNGKPTATSYSLSATIESGTAGFLTKYTNANNIGNSSLCNISNISYSTVTPDYTSGGEQYYKAWLIYICQHYSTADLYLGTANPNSKGPIIGNIYSVNDRANDTNLPRYSTFWFNNLSGSLETFGTYNYNYYHHTYLTDNNYTSYTVTKTGGGASGNWAINITGNAATANTASSVAWANVSEKPIDLVGYSGALNTNGWKTLGGRSSGSKIYISYNNNAATWNSETYSASMVFGCNDTKGLIDCGYNTPKVTFGGGSVNGTTDNDPKWYFRFSATSGQTYTLPAASKTLAATDGSNASGTWGISITGKAGSVDWANTGHPATFPPETHTHDYAPSSTVSCTTANVKSALGISSGGSATKWLNEQGSWVTPTASDIGAAPAITGGYLPLSGGDMTGKIYSSAVRKLQWSASDTDNNADGASWYGLGTFNVSEEGTTRPWICLSNYWGLSFRARDNDHVKINGNIVLNTGNYSSYALPLSGGTMTGQIVLASTGLKTSDVAGYMIDQYGNFKHQRTTNTDTWCIISNAGTNKATINFETGAATFAGSVTASGGDITAPSGSIWAGTINNTTAERDIGVRSGSGSIYLYSGAQTNGNRGLYVPAHGTGAAKNIIVVDTNNVATFNGTLSGNASSASQISATLDQTHITYLLGTKTTITGTAANVSLTGDTGIYLTTTAGELSAVRHSWNISGAEKAYTTYNSTDDSIDFIFV